MWWNRRRERKWFSGSQRERLPERVHHFWGLGFFGGTGKQERVSSQNSGVVRLPATTQVLQMRGGADTDEKTGAWSAARLRTHGPCVMIFNSVHTVKFVGISCEACASAAAGVVGAKAGGRSFQELKRNRSRCARLLEVLACTPQATLISFQRENLWRQENSCLWT